MARWIWIRSRRRPCKLGTRPCLGPNHARRLAHALPRSRSVHAYYSRSTTPHMDPLPACPQGPGPSPVRSLASAVGTTEDRDPYPTLPYHTSSRVVHDGAGRFFVDKVAIRVYPNDASKPPGGGGGGDGFFPIAKPMYIFSSIWNADDWATRGGLEKTDWAKAPFVSSYRDFAADACAWPPPASAWTTPGWQGTSSSTTTATTASASRRRPRSASSGPPRPHRDHTILLDWFVHDDEMVFFLGFVSWCVKPG
jgi:hypothetical protein